jgi:hypothetical protein
MREKRVKRASQVGKEKLSDHESDWLCFFSVGDENATLLNFNFFHRPKSSRRVVPTFSFSARFNPLIPTGERRKTFILESFSFFSHKIILSLVSS